MNTKVYTADPSPYYGREGPKKFVSNLMKDTVKVDIDLADLSYTFPSTKNLRKLQFELERLTNETKLKTANGRKMKNSDDSYYDPTRQGTQEKIETLKKRIAVMDYELSHNFKPDLSFEKENLNPQIQNPGNYDKERGNQLVADSYFYPVDINKLAKGKGENNVLSNHGLSEKSKYYDNDKKIETTAESVGEVLGNKYVKDEPKIVQSKSPIKVETPKPVKDKNPSIDDGTLNLVKEIQAHIQSKTQSAVQAKTEKNEDDNDDNCENDRLMDADKKVLNSIIKHSSDNQLLMARQENEIPKPSEDSNQKTQNNVNNKNEATRAPASSNDSNSSAPSKTEATPPLAQNKINNQIKSQKVEINPALDKLDSQNQEKL